MQAADVRAADPALGLSVDALAVAFQGAGTASREFGGQAR